MGTQTGTQAPTTGVVGDASQGLIPPSKGTFGVSTVVTPLPAVQQTAAGPGGGQPEITVTNPGQTLSGQVQNEYYVYWVDGEDPPSYVVIWRQLLSFNAVGDGQYLANNGNCRGYFA